jgi:hypothetical protein
MIKKCSNCKKLQNENEQLRTELRMIYEMYYEHTDENSGFIKRNVWLEKNVRKALIKEASKEGQDPADYIRGIIYSLNKELAEEEIAERERQDKIQHNNRKIPVQLTLDKELREKLFKRYKKELQNEELREKVKGRPVPMNRTTVEDRMLQEVLNSHLMEYLNK